MGPGPVHAIAGGDGSGSRRQLNSRVGEEERAVTAEAAVMSVKTLTLARGYEPRCPDRIPRLLVAAINARDTRSLASSSSDFAGALIEHDRRTPPFAARAAVDAAVADPSVFMGFGSSLMLSTRESNGQWPNAPTTVQGAPCSQCRELCSTGYVPHFWR
ncbi:hypothetical protein PV325_003041 [Microctonus aethiopoides]|nr:hypothetical protein PV325_003041 [Microctonus aethiopoides]